MRDKLSLLRAIEQENYFAETLTKLWSTALPNHSKVHLIFTLCLFLPGVVTALVVGFLFALIVGVLRWSEAKMANRRRTSRRPAAPTSSTFLFYMFLDAKIADALIGDIEERYPRMRKKFGQRRADFWVWSQTIHSLGPIIWAWGKKAAGITALYEAWIKLRS